MDAKIVVLLVAILVTYVLLKYWKTVLRAVLACLIGLAVFGLLTLWNILHL